MKTCRDLRGMAAGDIVGGVNGKPERSGGALHSTIELLRIGETVTLDILRNGQRRSLQATIAEPEETQANAGRVSRYLAGAVLGDLPPGDPLARRGGGVEVLEMERGSPAWRAGLRANDIIISTNRQAVDAVAKVTAAVQRSPDSLLLNIQRGSAQLFIAIKSGE